MKIAIVGFPGCGKSTCFKAITQKSKSETETLDPTKAHLGAVKIFDPRLKKLKTIFNPQKVTYAEIVFEDLPGFHIPQIKEVEALMEVLGVFSGRDPAKDIEDMEIEFILSDLEIVNHRLPSLDKELRQGEAREKILEREILEKFKANLEKNRALRDLSLTKEEEKEIRGFRFLSRKPLFILGNINEGEKSRADILRKLEDACRSKGFQCVGFSAKLESEIVDLEKAEREEFLKEMGIDRPAHEVVLGAAYKALGYITFFTVKGKEARAWAVKDGITAIEAAGKIHSDIQKGFIKAEVVNFDDLETCGALEAARKKALLKLESKEYKIRDGDVIDFRFNV